MRRSTGRRTIQVRVVPLEVGRVVDPLIRRKIPERFGDLRETTVQLLQKLRVLLHARTSHTEPFSAHRLRCAPVTCTCTFTGTCNLYLYHYV